MTKLNSIVSDIEANTGQSLAGYSLSPISGGGINTAYKLHAQGFSYFIKLNQSHLVAMFAAEAKGLEEMRAIGCIRIPEVICFGQGDGHSYIALEYIELSSLRGNAANLLGRQLAQLHHHTPAFFGWSINNTIGSTAQYNNQEHDWLTFWQQHRLAAQLQFAANNGFNGRIQTRGKLLLDKLPLFFDGYEPKPSLLHGDLWSGNAAADSQGKPVIFDPACYYGDRETDIAMTELFGGFGDGFLSSYQAEYPLDSAYKTRKTLYNLYHIINHLNLFGGGYLAQSETMIEQLLAEI